MASLIDVVFLLLVYFMVTSSLVKKEADLSFKIPILGNPLEGHPVELCVELDDAGMVSVEGERFSGRDELFQRLELLKAVADASQNEVIVSVSPTDRTNHGAIVPVMDACAAAEIRNISFSTEL